ncbi:hypothetical protein [Brevibacillus sp. AG]|uniref:hypothetical protein n=1 Tax=Brevibacillus sp. AG TaxID=3020891 RepID=UPI002FEE5983
MCGRFTLAVDGQVLIDRYNLLDIPFPFVSRFNAAPRQYIPAILRTIKIALACCNGD